MNSEDSRQLKKKAIKGVSWNAFSSVINQLAIMILGIILANLLEPSHYGLIGMVVVITGFANILQEMGFNAALIQKQDITDIHYSSVFWFNTIVGLILMIFFILIAPAVATFYNEPYLVYIMPVMATSYLVNAGSMVHFAMLKKNMEFKTISLARILGGIIAGIIGVIIAYLGYGVWALVVQSISATVIVSIWYWTNNKWIPKLTMKKWALQDLLRFSAFHFGTRSLDYWIRKFDNLLIGKFLGKVDLGYYSKAYRFLFLPSKAIKSNIVSVAISSFSLIQDDHVKIRKSCIFLTKLTAFIIFPIMIPLAFFSDDFVLGFLGEKWAPMIPILSVFAIASLPSSVFFPGSIYLSQGRTDSQFKINLLTKIVTIILVVLNIKNGIFAISVAASFGIAFDWFMQMYVSGKLIKLKLIDLIIPLLPIIAICLVASFTTKYFFIAINYDYYLFLSFLLKMALSSIIYIGLLLLIKPKSLIDIVNFTKNQFPALNKYIKFLNI